MSRYTEVRNGLHAVVVTVTALKKVLKYEPQSSQMFPIGWVLLDSYRKVLRGQLAVWTYRFRISVVVPIQNSEEAEDLCVSTAMDVAVAIDANPQFTGVLVNGMAQSPDGQATWIMLGGVRHRIVDVFCEAVDKQAYAGAL